MPAMSTDELIQIVERGYSLAGLKAKKDVFERIGRMSQGLPHYAHRIGQESGVSRHYVRKASKSRIKIWK